MRGDEGKKKNRWRPLVFILILSLLFGPLGISQVQTAWADESLVVLNNGHLRFGTGSEVSCDGYGSLKQPFYKSSDGSFYKLTYSSYALDYEIGEGGDGTSWWNRNGSHVGTNYGNVLSNLTVDATGYVATLEGGYGTVVVTGTTSINGKNVEIENTYRLDQGKSFIKVTTRFTNVTDTAISNFRYWVGTRDDWVGSTDGPRKEKGNLVDGSFSPISNASTTARALRISTGAEGVLFYTDTDRANIIIGERYGWSNVTSRNPVDSPYDETGDDSYAFYVRLNDLEPGESDQFTWYYAAGALSELDDIIEDVASAVGAAGSSTNHTSEFSFSTSDAGIGYYVVVPRGETEPSPENIINGWNYASLPAVASGSISMTTDESVTLQVEGLDRGQEYTLYFVMVYEDDSLSAISPVNFATANRYEVIFDSLGGSYVAHQELRDGDYATEPEDPIRSGYLFDGWYESLAYTTPFSFTTTAIGSDVTIFAKWNIVESSRNRNAPKISSIIVNGEPWRGGTEGIRYEGNETIATVFMDIENTKKALSENTEMGDGNLLEIPVMSQYATRGRVLLTGDIVELMEQNEYSLSVSHRNLQYILQAKDFGIHQIARQLEVALNSLEQIEIQIEMGPVNDDLFAKYTQAVQENEGMLIFPPISFNVTAVAMDAAGARREITIQRFDSYVTRTIELPEGIDPEKITTGIVFHGDGSYSHVPTKVFQLNGKWYASIQSLTNSDYGIIYNPVVVESVRTHWSKEAVEDLASRLVIVNSIDFRPGELITRGDFADYIVRGLGLHKRNMAEKQRFSDVPFDDIRADSIEIAVQYGIITGHTDGTFRPDKLISRQQAMVMISRAMNITGLESVSQVELHQFADVNDVTEWAYLDVERAIKANIFKGIYSNLLAPQGKLKYGETAVAIRRLLQESNLINK
jgi:uncharacterized repeat protein (TIGR02543 family)